MKKQITASCILLIFASALGFFACEGAPDPYKVGTEALLTGLTVGNIAVSEIPEPIDSFDYDADDDLFGASFKTAALNRPGDTVSVRFKPVASRGARVDWGIGNQSAKPFTYTDIRVPANFDADDFLYFRVTSEDGEITRYYRFYAWVRSPVTDLASLTIDGMEANKAEGGTTWDVAQMGSISIRMNQSQNAEVEAVPFDPSAKLRYAITKAPDAVPDFQAANVMSLVDQDLLYVEVAAQNEVDIDVYKFRVDVGRIATVKTLTFTGDANARYEVVGKGTPAARWANLAPGNFDTADQPNSGFGVQIELDDPAATLSWALGGSSEPSSYASPSTVLFTGSNALAIKVVSDNGTITRYYRVGVTLLAANITAQPKSAYYYYYNANTMVGPGKKKNSAVEEASINWYTYAGLTVDDLDPKFNNTVEELSIELDRTGSFTYQWYEANSWYGGYGFDADGRILYYLSGDSTEVIENGFTKDDYHVDGFDEKKNVSLHNGGNQFYRMENPGRKIDGETSPTYTPSIDKRPFIDGFTNETHYYWVKVTDTATNRTVTSKRAVIVSERDPTKKHHIVDVNYDLWEYDGNGDKIIHPARNPRAFTYIRESRHMPIALPPDFNVNDYTVAIAQALFYLKDGTPWIQNWTQGDVGFASGPNKADELIIYYNLTNNNATLGLVGGGKEPQGGSLMETPTHVVIKPAGEEPPNNMPPFTNQVDSEGRPIPENNNKAQGWFTAYIELVELRFEGPARE